MHHTQKANTGNLSKIRLSQSSPAPRRNTINVMLLFTSDLREVEKQDEVDYQILLRLRKRRCLCWFGYAFFVLVKCSTCLIALTSQAGDLDMKSNWIGVHDSMVAMSWYGNQTLRDTEYSKLTMGGTEVASYKTVDSFQFARVYGAGHAMVCRASSISRILC